MHLRWQVSQVSLRKDQHGTWCVRSCAPALSPCHMSAIAPCRMGSRGLSGFCTMARSAMIRPRSCVHGALRPISHHPISRVHWPAVAGIDISSGTCESNGLLAVTAKDECDLFAAQLRTVGGTTDGSYATGCLDPSCAPLGCYKFLPGDGSANDGKMYFNADKSGQCSNSKTCVCAGEQEREGKASPNACACQSPACFFSHPIFCLLRIS